MWQEEGSESLNLLVYEHKYTRELFEWVKDRRCWHGTTCCVPIESQDNERNRSNEGTRFGAAMTMVVNKINMSSYSAPRRTFFSGLHSKVNMRIWKQLFPWTLYVEFGNLDISDDVSRIINSSKISRI